MQLPLVWQSVAEYVPPFGYLVDLWALNEGPKYYGDGLVGVGVLPRVLALTLAITTVDAISLYIFKIFVLN